MIYIKSFKNYDEFKQIFGVVEHGNGAKSRKNKILLACLKDRKLLKWWLWFKKTAKEHGREYNCDYLRATGMDEFKRFVKLMLGDATYCDTMWSGKCNAGYPLYFGNTFSYTLYSPTLRLDNFKGLCADGDTRAIRHENMERGGKAFKMKAGKLISKCIEDGPLAGVMPEQMKRWIGEEFAREWQSYAEQVVGAGRYTLHVNDNFSDIYDSRKCDGDFGSCMTDKDYWSFYRDAISCKAAYLTSENGLIVARCIVYSDVWDDEDNHYRLAERQYSSGQDDVLKQILVDMLIKAGEIDGYKRVGADCHDNKNFVRNDGESMRDIDLHIKCSLDYDEPLSYQDSFVYYDMDCNVAHNDPSCQYSYELNTTDGQLEPEGNWSEWNEEYIDEADSTYDDYYGDWCHDRQVSNAIYRGNRIDINGDRASRDSDWCWSDREDSYLYCDECVYVDSRSDNFLVDDCVKDYNGDWQFKDDCVYSDYLQGYILGNDSVHSDSMQDNIPYDDAEWSEYDGDYILADLALHSEITGRCYCSEESMLEDEKAFRASHALVLVA